MPLLHDLRHDRQRDLLRTARAEIEADRRVKASEIGIGEPRSRKAAARRAVVPRLPIAPM